MSAIQQMIMSVVGRELEILEPIVPKVFNEESTTNLCVEYDEVNDKLIVVYKDHGGTGYLTLRIGTIIEGVINFDNPIVIMSISAYAISTDFDPVNSRIFIASGTKSIVGEVSGNSITFGSPVTFTTGETIQQTSINYISVDTKILIAYKPGSPYYGKAVAASVYGTEMVFGTPVVYNSSHSDYISSAYDPYTNKVIIAYRDYYESDLRRGKATVATVSGNSVSFGYKRIFSEGFPNPTKCVFNPYINKVVIYYRDHSNNGRPSVVVCNVSGTSISFGINNACSNNRCGLYSLSCVFNESTNKIHFFYDSYYDNNFLETVIGTFSETTVSFNLPTTFYEGNVSSYIDTCFNSGINRVIVVIRNPTTTYGELHVV